MSGRLTTVSCGGFLSPIRLPERTRKNTPECPMDGNSGVFSLARLEGLEPPTF